MITNTVTNIRYLGRDILAGLTCAETNNTLATNHTDYAIANQADAYGGFNAPHYGHPQFANTLADDNYRVPRFGLTQCSVVTMF